MNIDRVFDGVVKQETIIFNGTEHMVNVREPEHENVMMKGLIGAVELEKSLMDELGGRHYGSNPDKAIITITKTGADIKTKLSSIESMMNTKIATNKAEQATLLATIPEAERAGLQDMNRDDYAFREVGHRITDVPKEFDDDCVWGEKSYESSGVGLGMGNGMSKRTASATLKGKYNRLSNEVARGMAELVFISTIKDNLDDKQNIKLTPSQAAVIGF